MKHAWLKLLTSLLWSKKFRGLPDNDHRIVYVCHLILAKLDLEGEPVELRAALCFVSGRSYDTIVRRLIEVGLFDADGRVKDFADTQMTPEAARMRRYRNRHSDVTGNVTSNGDSREQKAESREKKEEPPVAPHGGAPVRVTVTVPVTRIVQTFNEVVKPVRPYSTKPVNKAVERLIKARWAEGMREKDFEDVCRIMLGQWGNDEKMLPYLRPHTLFTGKMESYLQLGVASTGDPAWARELRDEMGESRHE